MKLAVAQMAMRESMEENYRISRELIREASERGADLICFPEGQLSRYVAQYQGLESKDFALSLDHSYVTGLLETCRESNIMAEISLCLKEDEKVYACALLVSAEGEILAVEKKKHIVRAPNYYEQDYFTPGDEGFFVVPTPLGPMGLIMCFDRHYPESFRALAMQGCRLAVVPVANDLEEPLETYQWEMRIPAFQNGIFTLMCNRVGREGNMHFSGQSILSGPDGNVLLLAGEEEGLFFAEINLNDCERLSRPYLALRRSEIFDR